MAGQAMSPKFTIAGLPELEARLAAVVAKIDAAARLEGIPLLATRVVTDAMGFCPVDTGRLRASLGGEHVEASEDGDSLGPGGMERHLTGATPFVLVGTRVPYSVFVEFGTSRAGAQPFLRPALHRAEAAALGVLAPVIRHSVKELI